jgi:hypothetical protein
MTEWTDHVKKVALEKNIPYKEAMKVAKESYKGKMKVEVEKPKEVPVVEVKVKKARVPKGKGLVTKMMTEDAGGAQHIYPITDEKLVAMSSK